MLSLTYDNYILIPLFNVPKNHSPIVSTSFQTQMQRMAFPVKWLLWSNITRSAFSSLETTPKKNMLFSPDDLSIAVIAGTFWPVLCNSFVVTLPRFKYVKSAANKKILLTRFSGPCACYITSSHKSCAKVKSPRTILITALPAFHFIVTSR